MGDWVSFTGKKKFVKVVPIKFRSQGRIVSFKAKKSFVKKVRVRFKRNSDW